MATTYYADVAAANDLGNGLTPATAKKHIVAALGLMASGAGDTLVVKGGNYFENIVWSTFIAAGSSWANKTRIVAAPGEVVWMKQSSYNDYLVQIYNTSYVEFDGINLDATGQGYAILTVDSDTSGEAHHIRWMNAELKGDPSSALPGQQGVQIRSARNGSLGGCEFINLWVHGNGYDDFHHGFYIQQPNTIVDSCIVTDVVGAGIQVYNQHAATPPGTYPSNCVIKNNVIHDLRSVAGKRHWGINVLGGGILNTQIFNNVVYNIPYNGANNIAGIEVYSCGSGTKIYNNTFFGSQQYGVLFDNTGANGIDFRNNICFGNGTDYLDQGSGNSGTPNIIGVNPLFRNSSAGDFRLTNGSPAQNTGATIAAVTSDKNGVPRPQGSAYDQGAYELPIPVLTSLTPNNGPTGSTVVIAGTYFESAQGSSSVKFNGVTAAVSAWSSTSITCTVPATATSGGVTVTVNGQVSNALTFTVSGTGPPPGITLVAHTTVQSADGFSATTPAINTVGASLIVVQVADLPGAGDFETISDSQGNTWTGLTAYTEATSHTRVRLYYKLNPTTSASHTFTATSANAHSPAVSVVAFSGVAAYDQVTGAQVANVSLQPGSLTPAKSNALLMAGVALNATEAPSIDSSFAITDSPLWSSSSQPASTAYLVQGAAAAVNPTWTFSSGDWAAATMASFLPGVSISSLTPNSGPVATSVVIAGSAFGATQGASTVKFNGVTATACAWSDTSITVPVPAGATTGNVVVRVGGVDSNGLVFTVTAASPPTLTSLTPNNGAVGTSVTIAGTNFGSTQGASTVTFNGVSATPTAWSSTSITVPVPSGATTGNVVVTVGGVASNGLTFTVSGGGSTGITLLSHTGAVSTDGNNVTTPAIDTRGASLIVMITGEYPGTGSSTVSDSQSNTWTALTSYTDGAGSARVTIWYKLAPSTSASHTFTVTSGANLHYPSVTVAAFSGVAVYDQVSGNVGTVLTLQPGSITPAHANALLVTGLCLGTTAIVPTIDSGFTITDVEQHTSNAAASNFAYLVQSAAAAINPTWSFSPGDYAAASMASFLASASLTSLSPNTGPVATSVTITGVNFGATQGTSTVKFNGVTGTPTAWSDTSITVPVPATATTGNVVVRVNSVDSNGLTFTVTTTSPTLTGLTPNVGPIGQSVVIAGTNFGATQGASTVKFNGVTATVSVWNNTSITCTVPATATTGNVVVRVSSVDSNGLTFTVVLVPTLTSLTPNTGMIGQSVVIVGTNFGSTQGSSTVKFAGTTATPTAWSSTSITVPVPVAAVTGSVVVTVNSQASNGLTFTVIPPPSITSLTPNAAPLGGTVIVAGANFGATQGSSTVNFAGVAAAVSSWSATSITCTVPATAVTGNVIVRVSSVDSNGVLFTVLPPGSLQLDVYTNPKGIVANATGGAHVGDAFYLQPGSSTVLTSPVDKLYFNGLHTQPATPLGVGHCIFPIPIRRWTGTEYVDLPPPPGGVYTVWAVRGGAESVMAMARVKK